MMTPSRARVGDTVRILVHGFQVSLSLSIWAGRGGRGTSIHSSMFSLDEAWLEKPTLWLSCPGLREDIALGGHSFQP